MKFYDDSGKTVSLFDLTPEELFVFKGQIDTALRKHLVGSSKETVSLKQDTNKSPRLMDRLDKLEYKE